ncbi:glycosyltransferase family 4 protein [Shewanella chilikensis]|uniref:glycosyltransferase family 4 protein n=1 Tax=Shewanella chilikensis TaxID=558541 RepID=UPI00200D9864|nr:glycosyltransferase family 4 protein [Shewanella chilikensis]MCL1160659.1 glycosyltransferase family 4 protein [Shewanella chilikensis]
MKILVVHNEYGVYSGEESAVYAHIDALQNVDTVAVEALIYSSENTPKTFISKIRAFFSGIFSVASFFNIFKLVRNKRFDVVHFHNIYPWVSISSVMAAKFAGAKVILTLHNFKHVCPSATLSFNGKLYMRTQGGNYFSIVKDNVYFDYFKSFGYYLRFKSERIFKLEWFVDKFIFVSDLQRDVYKSFNPRISDNSVVIPNFLSTECIQIINDLKNQNKRMDKSNLKCAFIGRATQEKGFDKLLKLASLLPDVDFFAFGDSDVNVDAYSNVHNMGRLSKIELLTKLKKLDFLLVPNFCYETFSISALEAIALGLKVIVTDKIGISGFSKSLPSLYVAKDLNEIVTILNNFDNVFEGKSSELSEAFLTAGFQSKIVKLYEEIIGE